MWRSQWQFKNEFFIAEENSIYRGGRLQTFTNFDSFKPDKAEELQKILKRISTQRKRKDVMPWLPDKFYERILLPMTPQQKKYLTELEKSFRTEHVDAPNILARLTRNRQICLDPGLLNLEGSSPKTKYILQYLEDYSEESVLIFSKFTSYLKILYEKLASKYNCGIIIGDTPGTIRDKLVRDFQFGLCKILLLNIDANKEGLTLDKAETTIFTDKYPPIGDIEQAEDRFIASTEEKAGKAHKILELAIAESYDERLYTLLGQRKEETDLINDYNKYLEERSNKK